MSRQRGTRGGERRGTRGGKPRDVPGDAQADIPGADQALEEFEARYRAVLSGDGRFDGQFVVAVVSTGIYCRPSCPAITPQRRNVRFLPTAAAAQAAGFRACLRCRPHAVPGTPEWSLSSDLAARAVASIADGVVDREGVAGLARRLSYSERHLSRRLQAELGAGPLALARAQRAQRARMLIETTSLPMIEVAAASGFSSVRQFNEAIKSVYGRTPTALRARGARGGGSRGASGAHGGGRPGISGSQARPDAEIEGAGALAVRLAYREPFRWDRLLGFLSLRAVPGVEEVSGDRYRRTLRLPRGHGVAELSLDGDHVRCALRLSDLRDLAAAVQRCRRLLDLDCDPAAPDAHLAADPLLAPLLAASPGLRVPGAVDGAELAARAVLGQQVSVAAARTAAGRLAATLGEPLALPDATLTHLFPSPEAIAEADVEALQGPMRRRATLQRLAAALRDGELSIGPGVERAQARAALLAIPGIGPWTAEYVAMRGMGDPDALPVEDLGLLRALRALGGPGQAARVRERAERWRPWRAYALMHLWASWARFDSARRAPRPAACRPSARRSSASRRRRA